MAGVRFAGKREYSTSYARIDALHSDEPLPWDPYLNCLENNATGDLHLPHRPDAPYNPAFGLYLPDRKHAGYLSVCQQYNSSKIFYYHHKEHHDKGNWNIICLEGDPGHIGDDYFIHLHKCEKIQNKAAVKITDRIPAFNRDTVIS